MKISLILLTIFAITVTQKIDRKASRLVMADRVARNIRILRLLIQEAVEKSESDVKTEVRERYSFGGSIVTGSVLDALSLYLEDPYNFWQYLTTGYAISYGIGFGYPWLLYSKDTKPNCGVETFNEALEEYKMSNGLEELLANYPVEEVMSIVEEFNKVLESRFRCLDEYKNRENFVVHRQIEVLYFSLKHRCIAHVETPNDI